MLSLIHIYQFKPTGSHSNNQHEHKYSTRSKTKMAADGKNIWFPEHVRSKEIIYLDCKVVYNYIYNYENIKTIISEYKKYIYMNINNFIYIKYTCN